MIFNRKASKNGKGDEHMSSLPLGTKTDDYRPLRHRHDVYVGGPDIEEEAESSIAHRTAIEQAVERAFAAERIRKADSPRIDQIKDLMRALTYGEMIELVEAIWKDNPTGIAKGNFPDILHQWAKS